MSTQHDVLSAIPCIYDAAVESSIWGDTLEKSARILGAKGAILLIIDQRPEGGFQVNHFSRIWSRSPERCAMYNEKFAHYEKPVWDKLFGMPKQNLIVDTEFWKDEKNLLERPDYRYLRENVGIVHKCAARLNDNLSWWDTLVVHFDESMNSIPLRCIDSVKQVLPHVAKSVELSRAFDLLKEQYRAVLAALDHVEVGLCVALQDGNIVVHNAEAERILSDKDGLCIANGKLFCQESEQNSRLQRAIEQTSQTAAGVNTTHELLFSIERKSNKESVLIEVAPLRDYGEELERNLNGALITLIDPSNTRPFSVERAASAYKLTEAEAAVCDLLVQGDTASEMADKRNVSQETIRSQIKSIYRRTNCRRRSDLIRLVLKTTPPITKPKAAMEQDRLKGHR